MNAIKAKDQEPGNDLSLHEERIRELAYQIWETEGCPDGQRERHWDMATKLAAIEGREDPKPVSRARRISKPKAAATTSTIILPPPPAPPTRTRNSRNKLDA